MAGYRRQAVQRETRRRTKQREQLVAKVQSIVAEVEVNNMPHIVPVSSRKESLLISIEQRFYIGEKINSLVLI